MKIGRTLYKIKTNWHAAFGFTFLALAIIFCLLFLFTGYNQLSHWYIAGSPGFYRQDFWGKAFFTQRTKAYGNLFCIGGLLASSTLCFLLARNQHKEKISIRLNFRAWVPICFLPICGTLAWLWGNSLVRPAFDEAFSAINCAGLPPFYTVSYYMLPNNHILFNFINGLVFHFATDKVFTGRLISLVCYLCIILIMYNWLVSLLKNNFVAVMITLVLMLQFPTWGFSFQARGYEFCSLAAWLAFFALSQYRLFGNGRWLKLYVIACAAGYWCIPVFLYFHVACTILIIVSANQKENAAANFWKAQLVIALVVFLLYLPALCFSGLPALIANKYVSVQTQSLQTFSNNLLITFKSYLEGFSGNFNSENHLGAGLLFFMPLTLFCFYTNKCALLLGKFFISIWVAWLLVTGIIRIFPPDRIMAAQLSISLAISCYTLCLLAEAVIRKTRLRIPILIIAFGLLAYYFIRSDQDNVNYRLYQNDINANFTRIRRALELIPPGKSIDFSDECFYWRYLYQKRTGTLARTTPELPQFYIRSKNDSLPPRYRRYRLKSIAGEYEVYKKPAPRSTQTVIDHKIH
ncbi:hypothetical protein KXD93_24200 [Mucilaginibacter sp. BJC16-A38]|uniref:hypothetical protein n=1 Tax=Mucilaginibacter phenanthrenivorans TaxID=1234842 RepID=UPI002157CAD6|nr:hypothetical protein [Mucilaginibacter phenanthrenivorans]MCR8560781.1 hypothetical protein [Mucilaginibacter phenanthrenivorans]